MTIGARLSDHVQASHTLYDGEVIAFFLNTDGNATTGVAGSERVIVTTGSKFGPDLTRVGTSNGSGFDFQGVSTEAAPWGRQTLSLDTLGITAPATIELRTVGIFDSSFYDFAPPDDGAFQFVIPPPPIRPIDPPPPPPKPENPGTSGQSRPSAVRRDPLRDRPSVALQACADARHQVGPPQPRPGNARDGPLRGRVVPVPHVVHQRTQAR